MPVDFNNLPIEDQLDLDAVSAAIWELLSHAPDTDD